MQKFTKRPDGRYETKINSGKFDENGKPVRITVYAKTTAELQNRIAEIRTDLNRGTYADDKGKTFGRYAESWLKQKEIDTSPKTYLKYEAVVRKKLSSISGIRLRDLVRQDIVDCINAEDGHPDNQRMIRLVAHAVLEAAIDDGMVYKNVASRIRLKAHRPKEKRSLTALEKQAIRSCSFTPAEKMFVQLLFSTGIRRGEALGLMKSDFDLVLGTVHIQRSVDHSGGTAELKVPKSAAGNRHINLPAPLLADLSSYLKKVPGLYVFPARNGAVMSSATFKRFWQGIYDKINEATGGYEDSADVKLTPHIFRHNYCSELYRRGVDLKTAQRLMGHSSVTVTLGIYTHLAEQDSLGISEKLRDMVI